MPGCLNAARLTASGAPAEQRSAARPWEPGLGAAGNGSDAASTYLAGRWIKTRAGGSAPEKIPGTERCRGSCTQVGSCSVPKSTAGVCRALPQDPIYPSINLSIHLSIHPSLSLELLLPLSAKPRRTRSAQRSDGTLLSWLFFFPFVRTCVSVQEKWSPRFPDLNRC